MTWVTASILRIAAVAILGFVLLGFALHQRRRRRVSEGLGDPDLLVRLFGDDLRAVPWPRFVMAGTAALFLALALLDPALASDRDGARGPIILILDASGSMLVDDVGPSRLELQRAVAEDFVALVPDLPIGIVAFAGRAFSLTPPTRDRDAVGMYLQTLDPTIVSQSGSALGAAIRQGISLLTAADVRQGTIILFGDGDETDDAGLTREAATLAGENGIAVHVVGVGTRAGGPVPALDINTGVASGYLRDEAGNVRMSALDDDLLRDIASRSAGGRYVAASDAGAATRLADILGRGDVRSGSTKPRIPLFASFSLAAFLLLMAEPISRKARTS